MASAVKLIYEDPDLVEVVVTAQNGRFAGAVETYMSRDGLKNIADRLAGFPVSPADSREVQCGAFGRGGAGGAARLRFFCVGAAGQVCVEAELAAGEPRGGVTETVLLVVQIEAADVDEFVAQLRTLDREKKGAALLQAAV